MSTQGHSTPASTPYTSLALWAEKLELPLTIVPCLDISDSISDWSLLLALESAALVSARFLLGDPSTLRWRVSSYRPL